MQKIALALSLSLISALMISPAHARSAVGPAYGGGATHYACTHDDYGMVTVRAGAGSKFKTVDLIDNGTSVAVIAEKTLKDGFTWYKVKYGRIVGWARSDYICES